MQLLRFKVGLKKILERLIFRLDLRLMYDIIT
jgi:hypothetical protein